MPSEEPSTTPAVQVSAFPRQRLSSGAGSRALAADTQLGTPPPQTATDANLGLHQALRPRHLRMIALGGVIGAGLFVGSGTVIGRTGPAAIVSYALGGILVIAVMRMLGEMAAANPTTGSFVDYARQALGNWAGFLSGWLYWYFWVIVVAFEATAGASIAQTWIPAAPLWVLSLGLTTILTATNLLSVRSYGEFEYWFASIKVIAIVVFIALGGLYVLGALPHSRGSFSYLTSAGGFTPHGWGPVLTGVVTLIFAYVGGEIITVAAGESSAPQKSIARSTTTMVIRVLLFYVASLLLLVTITPWNEVSKTSPFAAALARIGLPFASTLMNAVVLTAVLSCLNSGIYVASRMLFALTAAGDAPRVLVQTNRRGVPTRAILACTAVAFLSVILAYVSPNTVFYFLTTSSGAVVLVVYLLIALSHIRLRRQHDRHTPGQPLLVRMPLFPGLSYLVSTLIIALIASLAAIKDARPQLILGLVSVTALLGIYGIRNKIRQTTSRSSTSA